jgi:Na+/H+-dicarboxylate symporter
VERPRILPLLLSFAVAVVFVFVFVFLGLIVGLYPHDNPRQFFGGFSPGPVPVLFNQSKK